MIGLFCFVCMTDYNRIMYNGIAATARELPVLHTVEDIGVATRRGTWGLDCFTHERSLVNILYID